MAKSKRVVEYRDGVLFIECTECHQIKSSFDYFKGNSTCGLRSKCKKCIKEKYADSALEYRIKNRKKINKQKREAARRDKEIISYRRKIVRATKEFKEKERSYMESHRDEINKRHRENRQKDKRGAKRLRTWRLIKKLGIKCDCCSICGTECDTQAHHPDYNKWNEIIFLCPICHARIHAGRFECPQNKIINLLDFNS